MNKQPEKTAQTRQLLIDTFWEIAIENGIDKVTISLLTKKAGLNRSTFYVYFSDLEDLLQQAEEELLENFRMNASSLIKKGQPIDFHELSKRVIELFPIYNDKLYCLIGKNGDPLFQASLRYEFSLVFKEIMPSSPLFPYKDYIISYLSSAYIGTLVYWHESGRQISLEELIQVAHGLSLNGLNDMLK